MRPESDVVPHPRVGKLELLGHVGDGSRLATHGVRERIHLYRRKLLSRWLAGLLGAGLLLDLSFPLTAWFGVLVEHC